jgi:hypothetical protein
MSKRAWQKAGPVLFSGGRTRYRSSAVPLNQPSIDEPLNVIMTLPVA